MNLLRRLDPRRSLTTRIILVNLTLVLLALGSLALWTGLRLQKSIVQEALAGLELRALIIANGMREPLSQQLAFETAAEEENESAADERGEMFVTLGERNFKALVDSYARELQARVTILDPDLRVVYSSDPTVMQHAPARYPETLAALQSQNTLAIRQEPGDDAQRLFVAAPIQGEEGVEGVVQLSIAGDVVQERVRAMWLTLLTAGLALTLLFVLASIFLGEQITRPVHRLTAAAHRLAGGDLSARLEMDRQDELGELAAAFDHMAEEISQLLARERGFVANASHELRSPVTAIQLRAELLQMAAADDARRERYLREIRQESENLGQLLQQLLDLDRAQSATDGVADPLDIAPCLRKMTELMEPLAEQTGLILTASIPDALSPVRIAPRDCEMVFRNLLDNAIKYTSAGGSVHLDARAEAGWVTVVVRDTGMGVPAEDLPRIFDRFYRVDKARDRTGSGLGLALVQEIVEKAGGQVQAESASGQGLTITVRLPQIQVSEGAL